MNGPRRFSVLLFALAAAVAMAVGCGRNDATSVLTPTGIRPAPGVWPGSLKGYVFFDPALAPELADAPFPPTRIELFSGSELVGIDSLEANSREFRFEGLPQGSYSVVVRSRVFDSNSRGGLRVRDGELDIGNVTLSLNTSFLEVALYVTGSMPGFDADQIWLLTTMLGSNGYGIWTFPSDLSPAIEIPAGTYRFKLVTDESSSNSNFIGWGWSPGDTLQVPVSNHPVVMGSGPASDIVARFPVTGYYTFTLDERRQTVSVSLLPPPRNH